MTRIVVTSSNAEPSAVSAKVAVIDFTNQTNPAVVQVPVFGGNVGCVIDIDSSSVAAGNYSGGEVKLVNVSNPLAPIIKGQINTQLSGIGAIAISGHLVAVGERNGFRIKLIDISTPNNLQILGTANNLVGGFSSIAFINNNIVVAAGPNDFRVVRVDFTNASNPQVNFLNPGLSGSPILDADPNRNLFAVGDTGGTNIKLFDGSSLMVIAARSANLQTVDSVTISDQLVLAGSNNDIHAALINFRVSPPNILRFDTQLGTGSVTAIEGNSGAVGSVSGTSLKLFDFSGPNPGPVGSVSNIGIEFITSIGFSSL